MGLKTFLSTREIECWTLFMLMVVKKVFPCGYSTMWISACTTCVEKWFILSLSAISVTFSISLSLKCLPLFLCHSFINSAPLAFCLLNHTSLFSSFNSKESIILLSSIFTNSSCFDIFDDTHSFEPFPPADCSSAFFSHFFMQNLSSPLSFSIHVLHFPLPILPDFAFHFPPSPFKNLMQFSLWLFGSTAESTVPPYRATQVRLRANAGLLPQCTEEGDPNDKRKGPTCVFVCACGFFQWLFCFFFHSSSPQKWPTKHIEGISSV